MRRARVAEWILSLVLPQDRAASTVGDWMEDVAERGPIWFWSSVFRTVFWRVWSDLAESPGFLVGLAMRSWFYSLWITLGTLMFMLVSGLIIFAVAALADYIVHPDLWYLSDYVEHLLTSAPVIQICIGLCGFQTGRWIACRAPGKELAAGISACLAPVVICAVLDHVWGAQINQYLGSHPDQPRYMPPTLPSEIFLLAGIIWSRHKSLRSVAQ